MPVLSGGTEDWTACIYIFAYFKYQIPGAGAPEHFGSGGCKVLNRGEETGRATSRPTRKPKGGGGRWRGLNFEATDHVVFIESLVLFQGR